MRVTISKTKNAEHIYISRSFRDDNGKSTSKIFKKLGTMSELLPLHNNNRDDVLFWAKEEARILTEQEKNDSLITPFELSSTRQLTFNEISSFNGGYLFLQKLFFDCGLDSICRKVSLKYNFEYDFSEVLRGLIFARILSPSSKFSSYDFINQLIEQPSFELHDIYRSLDVLCQESDYIMSSLYKSNSSNRNTSVLYYDCTNFFFEIDNESGIRKYGKSKEHRPLPIVQLGLFLDGDGMPLSFSVFPGNSSEMPTLVPLEKKILNDFSLSKFIVCTDAGLASYSNRKFNNRANRSFVVTQSIKQLKSYLKEWALDPTGFRLGHSNIEYDISNIDESAFRDAVFYKERWINENGLEQRLIVSFSPKRKYYQRDVRNRQIDRAIKIMDVGSSALTRNPNSPKRFIEQTQMTFDGEIAQVTSCCLNEKKILEEELYDGFYAVCTTLDDDVSEVIKINKRRWEIEESFKIMKSEFRARPVFHRRDDRIKAHFMTCFLALYIYRLLEVKLNEKYTVSELIGTLKSMSFNKIKGLGYIPCYTRNEITDDLHDAFGFRTDKQIVLDNKMKKILKDTKSS